MRSDRSARPIRHSTWARLAGVAAALLCAGAPAVARADAINPVVPLAVGGGILLVIGLVMALVVGLIAWFVLKRSARKRAEQTAAAAAADAAGAPSPAGKAECPSLQSCSRAWLSRWR